MLLARGFLLTPSSRTVGAFRITPEQLKVIGGSPIAAQFPPEVGGGYLGFMEVLHQLHCLVSGDVASSAS